MAENTVSNLASKVNENNGIISIKPISFIEENGEILFTAEEIGKHLGLSQPRKAVNKIFNRNQKELANYGRGTILVSRDGQHRQARCFTEEGLYIISMLAQTPNAREFRARVSHLLRSIRSERFQSELAAAQKLAYEVGFQNGKSEGRASALAEVLAAEDSARAEGACAMLALHPKRRETLMKAMRYAKMGLSSREIAKLTDGNQRQIGHLLSLARKNGLLEASGKAALPACVQGSLLEVRHG